MIQIKKTILTLVALLLTAVTGAWAEEKMVTINSSTTSSGAVTATGFNIFENYLYVSKNPATITTSEGVITKLVIKKYDGTYGHNLTEANVGVTPGTITYGSDEIIVKDINAESVTLSRKGGSNWSTSSVDVYYGASSSATPVDIAWDAATPNIATIAKMPAGNVTVSVEYYPQATLAFQGLTAAVDAAAKTEAPLAVVADGAVTGGTLMYYVAPNGDFTQADAIALAEDAWSADIPTAETIDAAGTCYVWYYIKGDAEHSDTDPVPLPVTLLPEPTYTVEFAEGTNPEAPTDPIWTASPATDVKKGQTVTVTYTGSKKVLGVKAEKKAAGPVTYTELKGGEVLHVGDILSDANVGYYSDDSNLLPHNCPFTVIRANITGDEEDPIATPAPDGAYYVIQDKDGDYYFIFKKLPVTATSDGILITITGGGANYRNCTFSVHEP